MDTINNTGFCKMISEFEPRYTTHVQCCLQVSGHPWTVLQVSWGDLMSRGSHEGQKDDCHSLLAADV